jgi:hypothetical protein
MTTEFTLKAVTDFLESSGFHVQFAAEIGNTPDLLGPLTRKIGAIRLEITPKAEAAV